VPQSRRLPNNLDILATVASTAPLPPASSLPAVPLPASSLPPETRTAIPTADRPSKRKGAQPDYADLDENGEIDAPTPKKRRTTKSGAGNGKGANKVKVASGAGAGGKPPAATRGKRNVSARKK
jgi:hypothetical protein